MAAILSKGTPFVESALSVRISRKTFLRRIGFRCSHGHKFRRGWAFDDGVPVPAFGPRMACSRSSAANFATGTDAVQEGLITSINRPGGNVTGVSFLAGVLAGLRDARDGRDTSAHITRIRIQTYTRGSSFGVTGIPGIPGSSTPTLVTATLLNRFTRTVGLTCVLPPGPAYSYP
jgi:hypothetical protein